MTNSIGIISPIAICLSVLTISLGGDSPKTAPQTAGSSAEKIAAKIEPPTLAAARRQAEILHEAMHDTLQIVHHQYYREDQGLPIPAAILKEVFTELEKEQHITLRWLAVEGQAMNTDHKPQDDFERAAAKALGSGQRAYEAVEAGLYRRAGPITLSNHCLKCHVPDRKSTEDRTAGLIISMKIEAD